jgi:predicted nucleotidyltransferase
MKKKRVSGADNMTFDGYVYLTKRMLVTKARAGKKAAKAAMETMGYVVTEENGQIARKYIDGRVEVITHLRPSRLPNQPIILD